MNSNREAATARPELLPYYPPVETVHGHAQRRKGAGARRLSLGPTAAKRQRGARAWRWGDGLPLTRTDARRDKRLACVFWAGHIGRCSSKAYASGVAGPARDRCTPHYDAPEVLHATALVQQALMPRILTSSSSVDMRSWRSERSKVSSFATSPLRVQLPASANPPTTLPNHPHARKPNPLKAGARARRNHRLPGLAEGASAAPMESRP